MGKKPVLGESSRLTPLFLSDKTTKTIIVFRSCFVLRWIKNQLKYFFLGYRPEGGRVTRRT